MPKKNATTTTGPTRTVRLDAETHRKAKMYAAEFEMEVQAVLKQAVDEFLKRKGA